MPVMQHSLPTNAFNTMHVLVYVILLSLATAFTLKAAPATQDTTQARTARDGIYLELLGTGFLGSLNYERILSEYISVRVSLGIVETAMLNVSFGGSSKFEAGFGLAFNGGINIGLSSLGFLVKGVYPVFAIGYKYQPYSKGFLFRVTPIILYYGNEFTFHSATYGAGRQWWLPGISFGYFF